MPETFPATASSLLIKGKIFSQTSMFGEGKPNHHPAVEAFIKAQLTSPAQRFPGNCAELALVSDQLWGLDSGRADGRFSSLDDAAQHFRGAVIVSKKIRPGGNPEHGQLTQPCEICTALLNTLGVQVLSE
ncbi:YwqJ-related putative deaminase [Nocardia sp. NBC_01327]|uniref:YwqJ-related putative deaminase n=1 Tax=Nocardia sp. NBC_01327 TaxID=2903593 RepID=UPI002E0DECA4|nr:YwqJ-related putative deaminase [Nocardia sp. NBC_01327]